MSSGYRASFERASAPMVRLLDRRRTLTFLAILGLMVVGVVVPRVGFLATFVVAAFVGWLLALSWPRLAGPEKLLRVAVLLLVAAVGIAQAFPRG